MRTYESVHDSLKTIAATMSLHRLAKRQASNADKALIAVLVCGYPAGHFDIEFNKKTKTVLIASDYDIATQKYYKASCYYLPDIFQGLK